MEKMKSYTVLIGGYSQGASFAIHIASLFSLKNVISISGIALNKNVVYPGENYNSNLRVYAFHGENDFVINLDDSIKSMSCFISNHYFKDKSANHWDFWNSLYLYRAINVFVHNNIHDRYFRALT